MYEVFDLETTTNTGYKRKASPFIDENHVVLAQYLKQGETVPKLVYYGTDKTGYKVQIAEDTTLLVGHNIKFDLLWSWEHDDLKAFFLRGGRVWDTQYAEFLLEGNMQHAQMCALDDIVESYGGELKLDVIKQMWKAGVCTTEIQQDVLEEYGAGDVKNTEIIFLGQIAKARERGILAGIMSRMDGLLCTTEMEYRGLHIDVEQAMEDKAMLEGELALIADELHNALPEMPPELVFNWGSPVMKSCLLFGGSVKYSKWTPYLDADGEQLYAQQTLKCMLFDDGELRIPEDKVHALPEETRHALFDRAVRFKAGKKQGQIKTLNVKCDDPSKPKGAMKDYGFTFVGHTQPKEAWKGKLTDFRGLPVYSTGGEIIQALGARGVPFLKALANRDKIAKDLSTYYMVYDEEKDEYKGMLTCLNNGVINHSLNHSLTVTSRLSSTNPNLQNVPRGDWDADLGREKSVVKRMFTSRFEGGKMVEIDYSQLEVVVQALITGDEQMIADIQAGIDFHCKRLAAKLDEVYEDVLKACKDESHPDHASYAEQRTGAKGFTFQRAFGAGKLAISAATGMTEDEVQLLIDAEEKMYPNVRTFFDSIEAILDSTRVPTQHREELPDKPGHYVQCGAGFYTGITQARFGFLEVPAPAFKRKQNEGRDTTWYRPSIQNYPVQGTAGHIVQMALGRAWRWMVSNNNYSGRAYLVNTVHDCVWLDCAPEIAEQVAREIKAILESVPTILKETFNIDSPVGFPCDAEIGDNLLTLKGLH